MSLFSKLFGDNDNKPINRVEPQTQQIQQRGRINIERMDISPNVFKDLNRKYIAFDVETTGLNPYSDRIVELGAVIFENGQAITQFTTLVNPGCLIPISASQVNHITNEMLSGAPSESQIYPALINYLGDAIQGNTIICAHNAKFDMDFLSATLERLGFSGYIRYIDTLALSRKYLLLSNYKQDTVAAHYGFVNSNSHRAASDALICGRILGELLKEYQVEVEKQEKLMEAKRLANEELEVCAVIQDAIIQRGGSSQWISFTKNSNGYVEAHNFNTFLKFKFANKGQYIIIPSSIKTPAALPVEKCSVSEGGTSFIRLYFSTPFNIEFLGDFFLDSFKEAEASRKYYFSCGRGAEREAEQYISQMTRIKDVDLPMIIANAKSRNYAAVPNQINTGRNIKREDVVVNAVHKRCPLSEIKNYGDFDRGFTAGFPFYLAGEDARKEGDLSSAITFYDKARALGYDAPDLYVAYTKTYRKLKDYANEILIVEEYMERNPNAQSGELEARRNKAIELLYDLQQAERMKEEKALAKAQKLKEKDDIEVKSNNKRAILQLDDDGNIIREYDSVTNASNEVGVSPKSIRDAAKGVQKHAGGYVWKYKDEYESATTT